MPEVGKLYKHYNGGIYKIIDIENENICMERNGEIYNIGIDLWNAPAIGNNNVLVQRFREVKGESNGQGR